MAVNKCVKYLLFIFNLLFWICGCIILGVSIYLKVGKSGNKFTEGMAGGVNLMIAIGCIIMVLGFLGCCGAIRENRCLLLLFFIGLLLIFILLLAAGILGAVGTSKVKDMLDENLKEYLPLDSQPADTKDDLYSLQSALKCCGLVNGASDWATTPPSCRCNATDTTCTAGAVFPDSCGAKIGDLIEGSMKVVLIIAFVIAALLIFGMVFSMMLFCQIGKKEGATTA